MSITVTVGKDTHGGPHTTLLHDNRHINQQGAAFAPFDPEYAVQKRGKGMGNGKGKRGGNLARRIYASTVGLGLLFFDAVMFLHPGINKKMLFYFWERG